MVERVINPDTFQEIIVNNMGTLSGTEIPAFYRTYYQIPTRGTLQITAIESNLQLTIQLLQETQTLLAEVKALREEFANRPLVSSVLLNDLSNEKLSLINPVSVVLEETDEECLARWPEVNAFGIGTTLSEAIHNLKENISDLYLDLSARDRGGLGEIALDTLSVLNAYITEGK